MRSRHWDFPKLPKLFLCAENYDCSSRNYPGTSTGLGGRRFTGQQRWMFLGGFATSHVFEVQLFQVDLCQPGGSGQMVFPHLRCLPVTLWTWEGFDPGEQVSESDLHFSLYPPTNTFPVKDARDNRSGRWLVSVRCLSAVRLPAFVLTCFFSWPFPSFPWTVLIDES